MANKSQYWSLKYELDACLRCSSAERPHKGFGYDKNCLRKLLVKPQKPVDATLEERRQRGIERNREFRKTEAYRLSLQKYRSSAKYLKQYIKNHPLTIKELPK